MKAPEFDVEFGKRVRAARRNAHLTQEQLATRLGLSRPSIVNIEAGRQGVYLRFLMPLAEALGCPVASLLPFDVDRPAAAHPRFDRDDLAFLSRIRSRVEAGDEAPGATAAAVGGEPTAGSGGRRSGGGRSGAAGTEDERGGGR